MPSQRHEMSKTLFNGVVLLNGVNVLNDTSTESESKRFYEFVLNKSASINNARERERLRVPESCACVELKFMKQQKIHKKQIFGSLNKSTKLNTY